MGERNQDSVYKPLHPHTFSIQLPHLALSLHLLPGSHLLQDGIDAVGVVAH